VPPRLLKRSRIQNRPLGVGVPEAPMPTLDVQISWPSSNRRALSATLSISSDVVSVLSRPSAARGTQPVVPLGRLGTRISSHTWPFSPSRDRNTR
jgi:hypothetical protein